MAKKITAPKTYDPGKGRPKEHLAYLNEREMAYLRSINGNNMERGPKGLPSFPPKDAVGSSSKASPSRGPGGPSGPNSSPSGTRGIGGGGKGSTTGGRGPGGPSGPNSAASGSRGVGGGTKGPGGPSGPNSGPSVSRSPSQAKTPTTGGYKGPASPMSKQGASFSSPVFALGANRDYIDRQRAAVNSASKALASNKALKTDLQVGGIRSLSVGPIGTPVNVYKPLSPVKVAGPRITPAQPRMYDAPLTPGMTPEDMARRGAMMSKYEQEIRDIMRGTPTRTGDPISAGGFSPRKPASPPGMSYSGASFDPESPIQQSAIDRAIINTAIARSLGPAARPASQVSPKPASVDISGAGYGTFNVPDVDFENRLRDMMKPDINVPAPPSPFGEDERILKIEDLPEERPRIAAGTYTSPYDRPSYQRVEVVGGLGAMGTYAPDAPLSLNAAGYDPETMAAFYSGYKPSASSAGERDVSSSPPDATNMSTEEMIEALRPPGETRGISADDSVVDSDFISPTTQMPPEDLPETPTGIGLLEKTIPGKFGKVMKWAVGKEYESLSPQEKADVMERWAKQNAAYLRGGAMPGGVKSQTAGGGAPDIGSGGKFQYRPGPGVSPYITPPTTTEKAERGRPQQYYNWDAGVGIPSPGDSDYTLYLKYLEEKAAARAAVS